MSALPAPIVLLTDFGTADWYVAAMKSEILRRAPEAVLLDLTHAVPPGDIRAGAFQLACLLPSLPDAAIVLGVVDPGVGTARRAICGHLGRWSFAGPDNGLITPLLDAAGGHVSLHCIDHPRWRNPAPTATFHGRDLFAPAAARLALGDAPCEAGPLVDDPVRLPPLEPVEQPDGLELTILWADRFGNLVTNLGRRSHAAHLQTAQFGIMAGSLRIGTLSATFGAVPHGEALAYWGAAGLLEIAINGGSAAERTGLRPGDRLRLTWRQ